MIETATTDQGLSEIVGPQRAGNSALGIQPIEIMGAEAVLHSLMNQGVGQIFGHVGSRIMPVNGALHEHRENVLPVAECHHAVHAARDYAQRVGSAGACIVTFGPDLVPNGTDLEKA